MNAESKKISDQTPFAHSEVIRMYGLFMIAWSVLEAVIQTAIMKELELAPEKTIMITGKMQFHPRLQLLCPLLKLHGQKHKQAIELLNKFESFAHRNTIVHGLVIVGVPDQLTFVKYDGGASASRSFTSAELTKHVVGLNDRVETLQKLLDISNADMQQIIDATLAGCK
jgi:hypothetical protein